jgi:uncharacterized membrane protein YgcG
MFGNFAAQAGVISSASESTAIIQPRIKWNFRDVLVLDFNPPGDKNINDRPRINVWRNVDDVPDFNFLQYISGGRDVLSPAPTGSITQPWGDRRTGEIIFPEITIGDNISAGIDLFTHVFALPLTSTLSPPLNKWTVDSTSIPGEVKYQYIFTTGDKNLQINVDLDYNNNCKPVILPNCNPETQVIGFVGVNQNQCPIFVCTDNASITSFIESGLLYTNDWIDGPGKAGFGNWIFYSGGNSFRNISNSTQNGRQNIGAQSFFLLGSNQNRSSHSGVFLLDTNLNDNESISLDANYSWFGGRREISFFTGNNLNAKLFSVRHSNDNGDALVFLRNSSYLGGGISRIITGSAFNKAFSYTLTKFNTGLLFEVKPYNTNDVIFSQWTNGLDINTIYNFDVVNGLIFEANLENVLIQDWNNYGMYFNSIRLNKGPVETPSLFVSNIEESGFGLNWSIVPAANNYRLDIATGINFASNTFLPGFRDRIVPRSFEVITGLNKNIYYSRVRAANANGLGNYSTTVQINLDKDNIINLTGRLINASGCQKSGIYNFINNSFKYVQYELQGSVDDDLLINGNIYESGRYPLLNWFLTCGYSYPVNGAHTITPHTGILAPSDSLSLEVLSYLGELNYNLRLSYKSLDSSDENYWEFVVENLDEEGSEKNFIDILLNGTPAPSITIDWGDSFSSADRIIIYTEGGTKRRYFKKPGVYIIKIYGRINGGIKIGNSDPEIARKILSTTAIPNLGLTNFDETFQNCENLTSIPENLFYKNPGANSFKNTFQNCGFNSIPSGLFSNNLNINWLNSCFENCYFLNSVPSNLFNNNLEVLDFRDIFKNITLNTEVYSNLLENLNLKVNSRRFNVLFGGGNSKYNARGQEARNSLSALRQWVFSDNGLDTSPPEFWKIKIKAPTNNYVFTINILGLGETDFFITWGDSSIIEKVLQPGSISHTYALAKEYEITIRGGFKQGTAANHFGRIDFEETNKPNIFETTAIPLISGLNFVNNLFKNSSIKYIPENIFYFNPQLTHFSGVFQSCTGFLNIPPDIFSNNIDAVEFSSCFEGTNIESISEKLFQNNLKASGMNRTFRNSKFLKSVPSGLFSLNTGIMQCSSLFEDCPLLTFVPQNLFQNNINVNTFQSLFNGTPLSTASYSNLLNNLSSNYTLRKNNVILSAPSSKFNSIGLNAKNILISQKNWSIFDNGFDGTTQETWDLNLTGVSSYGLSIFGDAPNLKVNWGYGLETYTTTGVKIYNFPSIQPSITIKIDGSFQGNGNIRLGRPNTDDNLKLISTSVIPTIPGLKSFDYTFENSNITTIPPNIFKENPEIRSFEGTFLNNKNLSSLPSGIFSHNKLVENVAFCFSRCKKLNSIPSNIFANNLDIKNLNSVFGIGGIDPEETPVSVNNYSNILINLASNSNNRTKNAYLMAGSIKYNLNAQQPRNILRLNREWTILDGGLDVDSSSSSSSTSSSSSSSQSSSSSSSQSSSSSSSRSSSSSSSQSSSSSSVAIGQANYFFTQNYDSKTSLCPDLITLPNQAVYYPQQCFLGDPFREQSIGCPIYLNSQLTISAPNGYHFSSFALPIGGGPTISNIIWYQCFNGVIIQKGVCNYTFGSSSSSAGGSPAILNNTTIFGWSTNLTQSSDVPAINIDQNTKFRVVSKTTNLNIVSIRGLNNKVEIVYRWSVNETVNRTAFADIEVSNNFGISSRSVINFNLLGLRTQAPTARTPTAKSCINNSSIVLSASDYFNHNGGIMSLQGATTLRHFYRDSHTSFTAWFGVANPANLPFTDQITVSINTILSNLNSVSVSNGGPVTIYSATQSTIFTNINFSTVFQFGVTQGFLYEILYLGALPENITANNFPPGITIIKDGYKYYISGTASQRGNFNASITSSRGGSVSFTFIITCPVTLPDYVNVNDECYTNLLLTYPECCSDWSFDCDYFYTECTDVDESSSSSSSSSSNCPVQVPIYIDKNNRCFQYAVNNYSPCCLKWDFICDDLYLNSCPSSSSSSSRSSSSSSSRSSSSSSSRSSSSSSSRSSSSSSGGGAIVCRNCPREAWVLGYGTITACGVKNHPCYKQEYFDCEALVGDDPCGLKFGSPICDSRCNYWWCPSSSSSSSSS